MKYFTFQLYLENKIIKVYRILGKNIDLACPHWIVRVRGFVHMWFLVAPLNTLKLWVLTSEIQLQVSVTVKHKQRKKGAGKRT